jgi:hypothetical protein
MVRCECGARSLMRDVRRPIACGQRAKVEPVSAFEVNADIQSCEVASFAMGPGSGETTISQFWFRSI